MKKNDLCKLALIGISLGMTTSALQAATEEKDSKELLSLTDKKDQYVCSSYQNCGKCGGACNLKNPKTPGLTDEQKKEAEEYQKQHQDKAGAQSGPSLPGQEKCGAFCASPSDSSDSSSDNSASMRAKRETLRN